MSSRLRHPSFLFSRRSVVVVGVLVALALSAAGAGPAAAVEPGPLPGGGYVGVGSSPPETVTFIQRRVSRGGFRVRVDGVFGSATEAAVRRFQADRRLRVDGVVGRQTMAALRGAARETSAAVEGAESRLESRRPRKQRSEASAAAAAGVSGLTGVQIDSRVESQLRRVTKEGSVTFTSALTSAKMTLSCPSGQIALRGSTERLQQSGSVSVDARPTAGSAGWQIALSGPPGSSAKVRGTAECIAMKSWDSLVPPQATTLVVSPAGDDASTGTEARPLKTVDRALLLSRGGDRIALAPGDYARFRDTRERAREVTVTGLGERRPRIGGAELYGGARLRFEGVSFVGTVRIGKHPSVKRVAHDIVIRDGELTSPTPLASRCVTIRDGAYAIIVERNNIHDCRSGIDGPGTGITDPALIPRARDIKILRNRMERFKGDGIQFAHWRDVRIEGNVIAGMRDSTGVEHNDGIQVMGDSQRVKVVRNLITDSRGQLVLVQDELGRNDDILFDTNLVLGPSGNFGMQLGGVTNLRLYNNTVWKTKYGGVLLQPKAYARLANNVSDLFGTAFKGEGGEIVFKGHNLWGKTWNTRSPTETVGDPKFVNLAGGDLRLTAGSPAAGSAAAEFSSPVDITGTPRGPKPSMGALEQGSPRVDVAGFDAGMR